jgi:hypothetical protein
VVGFTAGTEGKVPCDRRRRRYFTDVSKGKGVSLVTRNWCSASSFYTFASVNNIRHNRDFILDLMETIYQLR